jgi:hypothetical protein
MAWWLGSAAVPSAVQRQGFEAETVTRSRRSDTRRVSVSNARQFKFSLVSWFPVTDEIQGVHVHEHAHSRYN